MYNCTNVNLSIHSLNILDINSENYFLDEKIPDDNTKVKGLKTINFYYNGISENKQSTFSIKKNNKRITSADMLHLCHNELLKNLNRYQCLVLAQTFSDRETGNPPLARILEWSSLKPQYYYGISELGPVAAIQCLEIFELLLGENDEEGGFLLGEQLIIEGDRFKKGVLPYGDAACGLHLKKGPGPIQIKYLGRGLLTQNKVHLEIDRRLIINEIKRIIDYVCQFQTPPDWVIVQNFYDNMNDFDIDPLFVRSRSRDTDFQSSDVWFTLYELISKKMVSKDDSILMISVNRDLSMSFVFLKFNDLPTVNHNHL